MATAKQIAARKLFAARAKAGTLKKKTHKANPAKKKLTPLEEYMKVNRAYSAGKATGVQLDAALKKYNESLIPPNPFRKKNPTRKPVKRVGVSKKKYESRPSQASGKAPSKRLKARRRANTRHDAFPNPGTKTKHLRSSERDHYSTTYHGANGFIPRTFVMVFNAELDPSGNRASSWISAFRRMELAKEFAQAYADKTGLQIGIKYHNYK